MLSGLFSLFEKHMYIWHDPHDDKSETPFEIVKHLTYGDDEGERALPLAGQSFKW